MASFFRDGVGGTFRHILERCGARLEAGMEECARVAHGFDFPRKVWEAGLGRKWRVWAHLGARFGWSECSERGWEMRANWVGDGMKFPSLF